jgi:PAS domain-containing protein
MTCTDVLDSRIDAAIRTLLALRGLRAGGPAGRADSASRTLRNAQRLLAAQIEDLAAARAVCDHAPAPRAQPAPLGMITTDLRGVITGLDGAIAVLLRRDPSDLIGRPIAAIVSLPDRRRFGHHICELIENPDHGEWQTRLSRGGSLITISVALRVQVVAGSLRWFVRDLRELRRAQTETFARQESVRGATRLLRSLARENRRLNRRLTQDLPGTDLPGSN